MFKILSNIHFKKYSFTEFIANIINNFYIRMYLIFSIGVIILNWLFVYIIDINSTGELVVLHYNVDFGVNLIGGVDKIYIIPVLGTIIFFVNLFLLLFILKQNHSTVNAERLFGHALLGVALLVNIFLFISLSLIYLINFFA